MPVIILMISLFGLSLLLYCTDYIDTIPKISEHPASAFHFTAASILVCEFVYDHYFGTEINNNPERLILLTPCL